MAVRIGSLCSGYGGLDLAVEHLFGATTHWVSEVAAAPARILAARWPTAPNHGDLTHIDWAAVEPVDIITAGYPCQPFSVAGSRKGTADDRHLWPHVRQAIRALRPAITVLENVAGHRSLGFDRVLGDLAEDGLHVRWTMLRASDVGAPHARDRIFIVAADADRYGCGEQWWPGPASAQQFAAQRDCPALEVAAHSGGEEQSRGPGLCADDAAGLWRPRPGDRVDDRGFDWQEYGPAIDRWADIVGRRPPCPVVRTRGGGVKLSHAFDEWMMGLPAGWVVDVPGVSREEAIEACGNGVVPQQAYRAVHSLVAPEWLSEHHLGGRFVACAK